MALYHKYRPQRFVDVVDQSHIMTTLQSQVKLGKVAHAYLFSGPRGVGKTTTARILAKAMNCTARGEATEPCGTCSSCTEIAAGRSIDVIEIDAASNTGVDHVREHIIDNAQFKPTSSKFKVFIIDEVHMLSTSAFNALLKTLEEPPAHVVFILATTELHKIPETILSRCQRFHFKKIPYDVMKKYLEDIAENEHITIESSVLDRVIVKADGCARDAISLVDQLMATGVATITSAEAALMLPLANREDTLAFLAALGARDAREAFRVLGMIEENGTNVTEFIEDTIRLLRLLLIMQHIDKPTADEADMSEAMKTQLKQLGSHMTPAEVVSLIDIVLRRREDARTAPIPLLPLEMIVVEWCEPKAASSQPTTPPATLPPAPRVVATPPVAPPTPATPPTPVKTEPAPTTPVAEKIPEPAPTTPTTPAETNHSPLDFEAVKKAWVACYKSLEDGSPSLASVLKSAVLTSLTGTTLLMTMPLAFYRDAIMEHKEQQRKVETILADNLGQVIHIDIVVDAPPEEATDELDSVTAVFGGQVVG